MNWGEIFYSLEFIALGFPSAGEVKGNGSLFACRLPDCDFDWRLLTVMKIYIFLAIFIKNIRVISLRSSDNV